MSICMPINESVSKDTLTTVTAGQVFVSSDAGSPDDEVPSLGKRLESIDALGIDLGLLVGHRVGVEQVLNRLVDRVRRGRLG